METSDYILLDPTIFTESSQLLSPCELTSKDHTKVLMSKERSKIHSIFEEEEQSYCCYHREEEENGGTLRSSTHQIDMLKVGVEKLELLEQSTATKKMQEHKDRMDTCAEYDSFKLPWHCSKMSKLKPSILHMKASNNSYGSWPCQTALDHHQEPQSILKTTADDSISPAATLHINDDNSHLSLLPSVRFSQVTVRVYDPTILPLVGDDKSSSSSLDSTVR